MLQIPTLQLSWLSLLFFYLLIVDNIYLCNYNSLFIYRKAAALQNKSILQYMYIHLFFSFFF